MARTGLRHLDLQGVCLHWHVRHVPIGRTLDCRTRDISSNRDRGWWHCSVDAFYSFLDPTALGCSPWRVRLRRLHTCHRRVDFGANLAELLPDYRTRIDEVAQFDLCCEFL